MLHKHDQKWFWQQLKLLPPAYIEKAKEGYQAAYETAYDAEPVDHKKQNAGRREANIRLREYIRKINSRGG